jgi:hypothetical protein
MPSGRLRPATTMKRFRLSYAVCGGRTPRQSDLSVQRTSAIGGGRQVVRASRVKERARRCRRVCGADLACCRQRAVRGVDAACGRGSSHGCLARGQFE